MKSTLAGLRLIAGLVCLLALHPAWAQGIIVDKSEIRFVARQLGVNVEGRFRRFRADVVFRPNALQSSKANFDIDLASIDLASEESETEVKRELWFNTARFPVARFESTSIRDLGGGKYEVSGKLSMKGVNRDLVVPITLTRDAGGNRFAEGTFTLRRLDYKLGEGAWSDTDTVANNVVVRVRMALAPGT